MTLFRITEDGWPSLECQEIGLVFGEVEERKAAAFGVRGHS